MKALTNNELRKLYEQGVIDEVQFKDELFKLSTERKVRKVKKQTLPMALSDEEFNKLLGKINPKRKDIRTAFLLAYESGMRISEITKLTPDHIDLIQKTIFIKQGKYSKDRIVPLPKTWKNYMIKLIPFQIGDRALQKQFKNALRKANLRDELHFHNLRHSFATHCIERGMPLNQLQVLMGHSTVHTTNVYIRANPIDALSTYDKIF